MRTSPTIEDAKKFLRLKRQYYEQPQSVRDNTEYKRLNLQFASRNWNLSMVKKYICTQGDKL